MCDLPAVALFAFEGVAMLIRNIVFRMSLQVIVGVPADSVEVIQDPAHTETGVQFAS